jgi:hypothetical protein
MLRRLRSTWLAGGGAFLLVVSLSGIAAAAPTVTDTAGVFVDLDGNGVADSCQTLVEADPVAAAATLTAADTDGDGTISVTEAAHGGWTGGANCNHGGYVSAVAKASGDTCDNETPPVADGTDEDANEGDSNEDSETPATEATTVSTTVATTETDCTEDPTEDATDAEAPPAVCPVVEPVPPVEGDAPLDTAPNAHGKTVSDVAQSDAVGGKNCNHGGAVSEAAKKDHAADAAARATAKAAKHAKHHGKGHQTQ